MGRKKLTSSSAGEGQLLQALDREGRRGVGESLGLVDVQPFQPAHGLYALQGGELGLGVDGQTFEARQLGKDAEVRQGPRFHQDALVLPVIANVQGGRVRVPVLLHPGILVRHDGVAGQGQDRDAAQQGAGQGVDLLQAHELHVGLDGLPPALRVRDLIVVQQAAVHHGLGLLLQMGRYPEPAAVEVIEGAEIRDPVYVHEADTVPFMPVFGEAVQVPEIVDGGEGHVPHRDLPKIGQGEQGLQIDLVQPLAVQSRPVREPGAVAHLHTHQPVHALHPGEGSEIGAVVHDQPPHLGLVQPL